MSNYQNYLDNLVKQPLEIKIKSLVAEIRKLWDDNRETIAGFKGVEKEIESRLDEPGASEDLSAFASKLKERLPLLKQVKQNLDDLNQYRTISDALKQTTRNLGDYCMNNLSLDEILKASEGTENLKEQAETQKTAFEQLQTAYMINQKLIGFFDGVDQQFKELMEYENINAETVNAFTGMFDQSADILAGLKFRIGRMKNELLDNSAELRQLVEYCRQEMMLQEAGHCHGELGKVHEEVKAELKQRAEQEKQEAERKQKEEEKKRKRRGRLIDNNDGTVSDPETGLMWVAQDNGCDINWDDAKTYCESFREGGYKDWRMPTMSELQRLYKSGSGYELLDGGTVYISELIRLTAHLVWSSEKSGSSAAYFLFSNGTRLSPARSPSPPRALPVRVGK
jgi:hypothetical protein